ncbi:MAG TPA: hypothetical protein VF190_15250 [Rhodothermales bacterium]
MTETPELASITAPPPRVSWGYRITFGIAAVTAAVVVFFFFVGIADGTVSSFNMGIWLMLLGGTAAVLLGGRALHRKGHNGAAIAVLSLLAVPALLYALFMLLVILSGESWN